MSVFRTLKMKHTLISVPSLCLLVFRQLVRSDMCISKLQICHRSCTECLTACFGQRQRKYPDVNAEKTNHDDVIKWKHFPRYWPFVRGIHRSPVNSPHKGQWRGALIFSLICAWINSWVNKREAGDLRRYHAHYDVSVMIFMSHCRISGFLPSLRQRR